MAGIVRQLIANGVTEAFPGSQEKNYSVRVVRIARINGGSFLLQAHRLT